MGCSKSTFSSYQTFFIQIIIILSNCSTMKCSWGMVTWEQNGCLSPSRISNGESSLIQAIWWSSISGSLESRYSLSSFYNMYKNKNWWSFFFFGGGEGERGREMVTLGNLEDIVTQKVKNQAYWNKHIFNCRKACQL